VRWGLEGGKEVVGLLADKGAEGKMVRGPTMMVRGCMCARIRHHLTVTQPHPELRRPTHSKLCSAPAGPRTVMVYRACTAVRGATTAPAPATRREVRAGGAVRVVNAIV